MPRPARGPTETITRPARGVRLRSTAAFAAALLTATAAGCAAGDGRELRPPTVPPPTTTVAPHVDGPVEFPEEDIGLNPELLPDFAEFEVFAAWRDGAAIAERHTCDGDEISPALTWTGVPDGTIELAITVIDEHAEGGVHWVVTGIDPAAVSMLEGDIPPGASELDNSFEAPGWAAPCPPEGSAHTYRFTVHALDQQLEGLDPGSPNEAVALIAGLALQSTSVTGTYER